MSANKLKDQLQIEEEAVEKIKQKQLKKQPAKVISENRLREKPEVKEEVTEEVAEKAAPVQKPKKKNSNLTKRFIKAMNVFGIFERNQIVHAMPFILFVTVMIMFYIANSYYAEGVVRDIDKIKVDLKERRAEYISTKSMLMYQSKQSEVAKALLPAGVKESTEPPKKIFVKVQTDSKKHNDGN